MLTAMVTPFDVAGALDLDKAAELATYLVDEQGNDGLVISGTTGESPTTSDAEKAELLAAVVDAVGDRAAIVAGVGTFDTVHTVHLAQQAEKAGADGVLVVTPVLLAPAAGRRGLAFPGRRRRHRSAGDAVRHPGAHRHAHPPRRPHRAGRSTIASSRSRTPRATSAATARVLAETDLAYYSGNDAETLPWLAIGAVGVVGTSTHFSGSRHQGDDRGLRTR